MRSVSERIVGKDCADAGEDGVRGVAELLDVGAGCGAGEPVRAGFGAAGGGASLPSTESGGLECDERATPLNEVGEGFVEAAGLLASGPPMR